MKFEIPSKIENLAEIEALVDSLTESLNISHDVYANILVSIIEAVKNAIIHGNLLDASQMVTIQHESTPNYMLFTISDNGQGFDYHAVPDPTLPENLEKEAGRGLYLISCLADDVEFNDKGNEIKLKFYIN